MEFLIQTELPEWQTATLRNELCFRSFQYVKKSKKGIHTYAFQTVDKAPSQEGAFLVS